MPFFSHYKFKATQAPLASVQDLTTAATGTLLQKNQGDVFIKNTDGSYAKASRVLLSLAEADARYQPIGAGGTAITTTPGTPASPGTWNLPTPTGVAGLSQTFGNASGWHYSPGGGSRMYMGSVSAANAAAPFKYQFIDCSYMAHVSFDVNLDTLPLGVVFAAYLVPMKTNLAQNYTVLANPLLTSGLTANPALADEWGVGYGDAQGVNGIYTTEVDIFEASGVGAQFTLHGHDRSLGAQGVGGIDNPGVWQSVHGMFADSQYPAVGSVPKGTYVENAFGPGAFYKINTQLEFHIDCVFHGPSYPGIPADTLEMIITLSQGANTLNFTVTSVGFPISELQQMVYTQSIWSTQLNTVGESATSVGPSTNTWWLDGVGATTGAGPAGSVVPAGTVDQRGMGLAYGTATVPPATSVQGGTPLAITSGVVNPMFLNYNAYATRTSAYVGSGVATAPNVTLAAGTRPVVARTASLEFNMVDTLGTTPTGAPITGTAVTPAIVPGSTVAWVLDAQYRGFAGSATFANWSARYNASYGIYVNATKNTTASTATITAGLIPALDPAVTVVPAFATFTTGMGLGSLWNITPPTVVKLQAAFSAGAYQDAPGTVALTAATVTDPLNYIAAGNIAVNSYLYTPGTLAVAGTTGGGGLTAAQSAAITANTLKVGISPLQSAAIAANTLKVGITPAQAAALAALPVGTPPPPPGSTGTAGLTQMYGNVAGWNYAPGGGSRIYLGQVDAANAAAPFQYLKIDMSNSAVVSFDVNIDTLPAGVVFASYLVPMKTNMPASLTAVGNTVITTGLTSFPALADEWGVGYGDAQGVNAIYTTEVDILEASGVGAQSTLHGVDRRSAAAQTALPSMGGIDNYGVWHSIHGEFTTQQMDPLFQGTYNSNTYGPGPQFTIDTQKSFHCEATFVGPNHATGVADTLVMTVVLTQGAGKTTSVVTSTGFTVQDLQAMVYVQSIWATNTAVGTVDNNYLHSTWWLDGVGPVNGTITDQRGWVVPTAVGAVPAAVPAGITNPMLLDYNAYSVPMSFNIANQNIASSKLMRPVCARTGHIKVSMVDTLGTAITTKVSAWSLDVAYRGLANSGTLANWNGRYNSSYGVFVDNLADTITPTSTKNVLIPALTPTVATAPVFATYTTGMTSAITTTMPPTVLSLFNSFSGSVGTTYVELTSAAPLTAITATTPYNIIPGDSVGIALLATPIAAIAPVVPVAGATVVDFAALRLKSAAAGMLVHVLANSAAVGGGGGLFESVASAVPIQLDDNGITVVSTALPVTVWKRLNVGQDWNMRWFGTVHDGVTDDASIWQNAIDLLSAAGGGVMRVDSKSSYINGNVRVRDLVHLQVDGHINYGARGRMALSGSPLEVVGGGTNLAVQAAAGSNSVTVTSAIGFSAGQYIKIRGNRDVVGVSGTVEQHLVTAVNLVTNLITISPPLKSTFSINWTTSPWAVAGNVDTTNVSPLITYGLTVDGVAKTDTLTIAAGHALALDDTIFVSDTAMGSDAANGLNPSNNLLNQETCIVVGIAGGVITLDHKLHHTYTVLKGATITAMRVVRSARLSGATASYSVLSTTQKHSFETSFARDCTIRDCHVVGSYSTGLGNVGHGFRVDVGINNVVENCSVYSPQDTSAGAGYGFSLYGATGCKLLNNYASGCRHSFILFKGAAGNLIQGNTSYGCKNSDYDLHGSNEINNVIQNNVGVGAVLKTIDSSGHALIRVGNPYHIFGAFDNVIQNNTGYNLQDIFIDIQAASKRNTVQNNIVYGCHTGIKFSLPKSGAVGATTPRDPSVVCSDNDVSSNTIRGCVRGLDINGNVTQNVINNIIQNNSIIGATGVGLYVNNSPSNDFSGTVIRDGVPDALVTNSNYSVRITNSLNCTADGVVLKNGVDGIYTAGSSGFTGDGVKFINMTSPLSVFRVSNADTGIVLSNYIARGPITPVFALGTNATVVVTDALATAGAQPAMQWNNIWTSAMTTANGGVANWTTSASVTPRYGKSSAGVTYIVGEVDGGTMNANNPIFTLPVGMRPLYDTRFQISTRVGAAGTVTTPTTLLITSLGVVSFLPTTLGAVGIVVGIGASFIAEQ